MTIDEVGFDVVGCIFEISVAFFGGYGEILVIKSHYYSRHCSMDSSELENWRIGDPVELKPVATPTGDVISTKKVKKSGSCPLEVALGPVIKNE